jgi:Predicted permease
MKNRIEIETRTLITFWLIPALLALAYLFIYKARLGLMILGVSLFLAIALNPIVSKISNIFPGKSRKIATAIAYLLVIAVLGTILFLAIPPIVEQTGKFIQDASVLIGSVADKWNDISASADQYGMTELLESVLVSLQNTFSSFAQNVGSIVVSSASSVLSSITAIILILVLTFLMLIEGPDLLEKLWSSQKGNQRAIKMKSILNKMSRVITNFVNGQLLVALIDGSFTAAGVLICGLVFKNENIISLMLPLGLLATILSLIPMFGAIIGGVISSAMIAFSALPAAIVFAIYFIVYQQIESNVISPAIQSKSSQLPALVVLGSVTVGVYLFGLVGAIIAIPVAGCCKVLLDEFISSKHSSVEKIFPQKA